MGESVALQYEGSDSVPWCSTATTSDGSHVTDGGHWGECNVTAACSQCSTKEGPQEGQPCVFPFTWQGVTHTECAPWVYGGQWEEDNELWCSTKVRLSPACEYELPGLFTF